MKCFRILTIVNLLWFTVSCGQQKQYVTYQVKKGETISSIARELNINVKDLLRLNPEISKKLKINTLLVVPNPKSKFQPTKENKEVKNIIFDEKKDSILRAKKIAARKKFLKDSLFNEYQKKFIAYEVKKGDTFYSLTRLYNVSREDLINLNPILEHGLKSEQVIKIKPLDAILKKQKQKDSILIDSCKTKNTIIEEQPELIYKDTIANGVSLKMAMLLPFKGVELYNLDYETIFNKSKLANIVTDFYLGAEIAIDSLRKQGVEVNVCVFDTEKNKTKVESIITTNNFKKNDVVIGPFYSDEANSLASKIKIPIVYPVYSKHQNEFNSTNVIKTYPNKNYCRKKLVDHLIANFSHNNIIIIGDGHSTSNFHNFQIKKALEQTDSIGSVQIVLPEKGYISKEMFEESLKENETNCVVVTTTDNIIMSSAINALIGLPKSFPVQLFAFDKVNNFNKLNNNKLAQLQFTFVSDQYSLENSYNTKVFNRKYFIKNHTFPSEYSINGFDITYDVLMRLASGNDLQTTFNKGVSYRLRRKFDYTNHDSSTMGVENNGLFILKYNPDLSLTRIE